MYIVCNDVRIGAEKNKSKKRVRYNYPVVPTQVIRDLLPVVPAQARGLKRKTMDQLSDTDEKINSSSNPRRRSPASNSTGTAVGTGDGSRRPVTSNSSGITITRNSSRITADATVASIRKFRNELLFTTKSGNSDGDTTQDFYQARE